MRAVKARTYQTDVTVLPRAVYDEDEETVVETVEAPPKVTSRWVDVAPGKSVCVWELPDGTPCTRGGRPLIERDESGVSLRSDPNSFESGADRFGPPTGEHGDWSRGLPYITQLRDRRAEAEGWPGYVTGKGPRPFQSFREKKDYMRRFGFVEAGDAGEFVPK